MSIPPFLTDHLWSSPSHPAGAGAEGREYWAAVTITAAFSLDYHGVRQCLLSQGVGCLTETPSHWRTVRRQLGTSYERTKAHCLLLAAQFNRADVPSGLSQQQKTVA